MTGALSHLRVLDLSRILAGPWASQLLADLGAEVIKIENPHGGDDTRHWGPPYAQAPEGGDGDVAAYFLCANRNKKSVAIDFTKPDGAKILLRLAEQSDVVIENFKVGGLKKYGLDWESLSKRNPRLIYCSITGFGQTGPYAARPGYDFLIQGLGGLMSLTGRADNEPGAGPVKVGVALTDILTGLYASNAILAALAYRDRGGAGQHIDLALLDVQVACLGNRALNHLVGDRSPGRLGNAHPSIVPYQDFPTLDGHMILAVGNNGQFERFCAAAGIPEWAQDPAFATNDARVRNRGELTARIAAVTKTRSTGEWIDVLEKVAVPCGPINELSEVFSDPQVQAREMARKLDHGALGTVPTVANPIRMSETPVEYRRAPPALGADTASVLQEILGETPENLEALRAGGVIGVAGERSRLA